jgi:hypothetical protein
LPLFEFGAFAQNTVQRLVDDGETLSYQGVSQMGWRERRIRAQGDQLTATFRRLQIVQFGVLRRGSQNAPDGVAFILGLHTERSTRPSLIG